MRRVVGLRVKTNERRIEAVREIICVLDDLILMAKLDRAPIRAVSILERAKAEEKACLDKIDDKDRTEDSSN